MSEVNQSQSLVVRKKYLKHNVCENKCVSEVNQSQGWLVINKIEKQSVCEKSV